jgi:hypothetical protein
LTLESRTGQDLEGSLNGLWRLGFGCLDFSFLNGVRCRCWI